MPNADLQWSRRPSAARNLPSTPIHRLGRDRSLTAIVLADDVLGVDLHWMGRSVPCSGDLNCPGCNPEKPLPTRWEGYVAIWYPRTNGVAITPITAGAVATLDVYRSQHGTLRGAEITCSRSGARSNAPLNVSLRRSEVAELHLPPAPDIARVLRHIWKLPQPAVAHEVQEEHRERPVVVPFEDAASDWTPDTLDAAIRDRINGRAVHA